MMPRFRPRASFTAGRFFVSPGPHGNRQRRGSDRYHVLSVSGSRANKEPAPPPQTTPEQREKATAVSLSSCTCRCPIARAGLRSTLDAVFVIRSCLSQRRLPARRAAHLKAPLHWENALQYAHSTIHIIPCRVEREGERAGTHPRLAVPSGR
ncbi:hypothetical protein VTN02DRAFT_4629 [Thermoascus thermophilus]